MKVTSYVPGFAILQNLPSARVEMLIPKEKMFTFLYSSILTIILIHVNNIFLLKSLVIYKKRGKRMAHLPMSGEETMP